MYHCDDPFYSMLQILIVSISDLKNIEATLNIPIFYSEIRKTVESSRLSLIERITIFLPHLSIFDSTQFHNII